VPQTPPRLEGGVGGGFSPPETPTPPSPPWQTLQFLRSCRLEVGMKNNVKWELSSEIVARHFLRNLRVFVPPHALKLPQEPITRWGEYWCEVTVS
ncbi:RM09 protein, partial [Rostratula benghalensis]|nr:RM09 protein [Rostratula benghalensis]